jgi:hypothetical protein
LPDLQILFSYVTGTFEETFAALQAPVAAAATASIRAAGDQLKRDARADIAAAGFSSRWQNALRVNIYPKSGNSIEAAAFLYHKIAYADIFEEGGSIRGKPLLWLPLPNTPVKIGSQKMTPALYEAEIGPLRYVSRGGLPPLLVAEQAPTRSKKTKFSLSSLRRGAAAGSTGATTRTVPLFIGLDAVTMAKKFHIQDDAKRAAEALPGLFADNLKDE